MYRRIGYIFLFAAFPGVLFWLFWQGVPPAPQIVFTNSLGLPFVSAGRAVVCVFDVRVKDYSAFVKETGRKWENPPIHLDFSSLVAHGSAPPPVSSIVGSEDDPAINVSWQDAQDFCVWLTNKEKAAGVIKPNQTYRLPADAEWSTAACIYDVIAGTPAQKSGQIVIYLWGTSWPPPYAIEAPGSADGAYSSWINSVGNYDFSPNSLMGEHSIHVTGQFATTPVGRFPANGCGLYDMGGNVWQWCQDDYMPNQNNREKVLRGGSWRDSDNTHLDLNFRDHLPLDQRRDNIGFRLLLAEGP